MNNHGNITDKRPPFIPTLIGTGFGAGFWPWGPGTAGSIAAAICWLLLSTLFDSATLQTITLALAIGFTILGTWATAQLQPYWGEDPSRVVIDEMVGMWVPLSVLTCEDTLWTLAVLVIFRFFDIVKPLGIKTLDKKPGAFWVMGDDILGGIYTLLCITLLKIFFHG